MKKKIIILSVICLLLIAAYVITLCILVIMPVKVLNSKYAGRDINTSLVNNTESYYIKFAKVVPYGFPFKLAIKVVGWTEESKVGKIECLSPLFLGYDLIEQKLFGRYAGETLAWHKPLQSKFGSKVSTEDYELSIKISFLKIIKILFSKNINSFEIVNFINAVELKSGKEQIFDIVGHEKLYDQDFKNMKLTFVKRKHYTDIQDFLNNLPSQIDFEQNAKINEIVLLKRALPPTILFGLNLPYVMSGSSKITLKLNQPNIADLTRDLEVYANVADSTSDVHEARGEITYKGKINHNDADIYFKINSEIEIKSGFFNKVFESLKNLIHIANLSNKDDSLKEGSPVNWIADNFLTHIDNAAIRELEGHKYLMNLDVNFGHKDKDIKITINDLSLFSGKTGIVMRGDNKVGRDFSWMIKGDIGINNQPRAADLLVRKDIFGVFSKFSSRSRELYADVSGQFLKSISEHPQTTSDNINLEYSFGSKQLSKGKIGTVNADNLSVLFDLALYKEAVKRASATGNTAEIVQELVPTLSLDKQKALEKLITNPTVVEQNTWNELIK